MNYFNQDEENLDSKKTDDLDLRGSQNFSDEEESSQEKEFYEEEPKPRKKITQNEVILFLGLVISFFSILMKWYFVNNVFSYSGTKFFTGGIATVVSLATMIVFILPFADVELSDLIDNLKISDKQIIFYGSIITAISVALTIVFTIFQILGNSNISFANGFFFAFFGVGLTYFGAKKFNEDNNLNFKFPEKKKKDDDTNQFPKN